MKTILGYELKTLILVMATAVGAWGGFPAPPRYFNLVSQNPLVQWALVFTLIYQGGSGQDVHLALLGTGLLFSLHQALNLL